MAKTQIKVQLSGTDGNVFALGGRVSSALKEGGERELAQEFISKLFKCGSYDNALSLMAEYVEVY
jgi:hypothetical protein